MLADASDAERDVFQHFATSRNDVVLHTDERMLPRREAARASWNYLLHLDERNGHSPVTMTYDSNRLQSLDVKENYCVTLNANGHIRPTKCEAARVSPSAVHVGFVACAEPVERSQRRESHAFLRRVLVLRIS